jgi:hypothetical protein
MEREDEGNEALRMFGDGANHLVHHRMNQGCRFLKWRQTMVSKLSKRIEDFELRLKQLESTHQDITFKAVLELTNFVHELSQKIDEQQQATALHD